MVSFDSSSNNQTAARLIQSAERLVAALEVIGSIPGAG